MEKFINTKELFRERKLVDLKNYGRVSLLSIMGNIYSGIPVDRTGDWLLCCQGLTAIQAVSVAARRNRG
jgi:hypothetical protein